MPPILYRSILWELRHYSRRVGILVSTKETRLCQLVYSGSRTNAWKHRPKYYSDWWVCELFGIPGVDIALHGNRFCILVFQMWKPTFDGVIHIPITNTWLLHLVRNVPGCMLASGRVNIDEHIHKKCKNEFQDRKQVVSQNGRAVRFVVLSSRTTQPRIGSKLANNKVQGCEEETIWLSLEPACTDIYARALRVFGYFWQLHEHRGSWMEVACSILSACKLHVTCIQGPL